MIVGLFLDEYGVYDERKEELYMMSSYDTPDYAHYDVDIKGDDLTVDQTPDYMVDWDTLFGAN